MGHNSTAKAVRLNKKKWPERYCIVSSCLHRAPCPKHCKPSEPISQFTKYSDEGCMNDMRFGDSPDF